LEDAEDVREFSFGLNAIAKGPAKSCQKPAETKKGSKREAQLADLLKITKRNKEVEERVFCFSAHITSDQ
jgi:hypothetical protein